MGRRELAAWTTVAMLLVSLPLLAHAQTTTAAPRTPATTPKAAPTTPPAKPAAAAKPAPATPKPATTQGAPGTPTKVAPPTAPKTGTAAATAKPAAPKPPTASRSTTAKEPVAAKPTAPAVPVPVKPAAAPTPEGKAAAALKPPAPPSAAPRPAPPPQTTALREAAPTGAALPGAPVPVAALGMPFRQRHPLVGGFLTGLLGVALADSLLGEEAAGAPPASGQATGNVLEPVATGLTTAELAGQLTRLALFGALVALAVLLYRRRWVAKPVPNGTRLRSAPSVSGWDELNAVASEPPSKQEPAVLGRSDALEAIADEQDFTDILLVVQAAWSEGDVMAMRGHVTPDMATYFDRRLAQNVDNGIENRVVDCSSIRAERLADWEEDGLHYAKARMRWRALDYIIDLSKLPDEPGYIIDGSPENPVDCEETWTFVKSPDGAWLLCEVAQNA